MVMKKIDVRVRNLIENGVKLNHRSFFMIIGDNARNQVINFHHILSKASLKPHIDVLWCYKKELGFISNKTKRRKKNRQNKKGAENEHIDPFELFLSSVKIRFTYYHESHKILGNTYGMLVLQDFEAITPNLLARTIETVEGGGIVILLLKAMASLKQLYSLAMDVHKRFRNASSPELVNGRFNERFLLSLSNCPSAMVIDDEFNIIPLSSHSLSVVPVLSSTSGAEQTPEYLELQNLKSQFRDTATTGSLLALGKTLDQGKMLLLLMKYICERSLRATVAITAARGRGKSAVLGLCIAGAIAQGFSNIFVTAPAPENLKTLFQFIVKGLDSLDYVEHHDFEILEGIESSAGNVVRMNVFRGHRQTIQYIAPDDHKLLAQAEFLVVDEAAAIPLKFVKKLLGPYLVMLSSTVNGYEGTGRSLSLKLFKELREQSVSSTSTRTFEEMQMQEPIRYSTGDKIEEWLNELLCLNSSNNLPSTEICPPPSDCQLYYVNRDTLFSYHSLAEEFLQKLVALFTESHYKNSPNDLMLLSDAPTHHIFVLAGPIRDNGRLPDIFCAIQVCLEGKISKSMAFNEQFSSGGGPPGDIIPWTLSHQYQDTEFPKLLGVRVVRIATHPQFQKMGYASWALQLLKSYYEGKFIDSSNKLKSSTNLSQEKNKENNTTEGSDLMSEVISVRKSLRPLLEELCNRPPENLYYIGVGFGLTSELFRFWKANKFVPVYLRLSSNAITGEHTCIMMYEINTEESMCQAQWLQLFTKDFRRRFLNLLSYDFKSLSSSLALNIIEGTELQGYSHSEECESMYRKYLSDFDIYRLEKYSKRLVDYHLILDLLPHLAHSFFLNETPVVLSSSQKLILLGTGLQHKTVEEVTGEIRLEVNQGLALFNKGIRKFSQDLIKNLEQRS